MFRTSGGTNTSKFEAALQRSRLSQLHHPALKQSVGGEKSTGGIRFLQNTQVFLFSNQIRRLKKAGGELQAFE